MKTQKIILDSLADEMESIVQIQEYFTYLGYTIERQVILSEIESLLKSNLIRIRYPDNITKIDEEKIEDYWFELSELGKREWEKISEDDLWLNNATRVKRLG